MAIGCYQEDQTCFDGRKAAQGMIHIEKRQLHYVSTLYIYIRARIATTSGLTLPE